jgi:hypothetical protein
MMGVLGAYLYQGWFYSSLFSGKGLEGVKYCWNRCSPNFSFQNKFIIVLPWVYQVYINTFSKACIFKSFTGYTDDGGYETKSICFNNNNKTKGNGELIMVILNCTLMHNQNDGWTVN